MEPLGHHILAPSDDESPQRHFHKSTLRQNDPRVALDDGKNLANITSLLNLASAAHLAPKLPRMHKEEEEVWQYEPAHGSLEEEAQVCGLPYSRKGWKLTLCFIQGVLDILAVKLITPIVEFAAQQPPVSPFDEQEQDWTRRAFQPALSLSRPSLTSMRLLVLVADADDDLHKLPKRGSTGGGYAATMTSRNGILTIYTKARRASGAVELESVRLLHSPIYTRSEVGKRIGVETFRSAFWRSRSSGRLLLAQCAWKFTFYLPIQYRSDPRKQHFIRLVASEELLTEEQAQEVYAFAATALALAALSPRPAIFAPLLPAVLHDLQFELEEEERAGRLEVRQSPVFSALLMTDFECPQMLLALVEQQYKAALLGLVQLTDSEVRRTALLVTQGSER